MPIYRFVYEFSSSNVLPAGYLLLFGLENYQSTDSLVNYLHCLESSKILFFLCVVEGGEWLAKERTWDAQVFRLGKKKMKHKNKKRTRKINNTPTCIKHEVTSRYEPACVGFAGVCGPRLGSTQVQRVYYWPVVE